MRGAVVFLHYHGIGHINPCFPVAEILKREQWQIHFAGAAFFGRYITTQGYSSYPLHTVPFGMGFEQWVSTTRKSRFLYGSNLMYRIKDRLYEERQQELVRMLDDLNPAVIFIDATQATDFIVLYRHLLNRKIKVAVIHAMTPTQILPGRPPVNSLAFPEDEENVQEAMRKLKWMQYTKVCVQKIKFITFDDRKIIARRIKKNRFPRRFCSPAWSLFNFMVQHVPEFILSPREFDFPTFEPQPAQHYIGFMTHPGREDFPDANFHGQFEIISKRQEDEGTKLVYCSFGTIESGQERVIFTFLHKLIEAVNLQGHLLVLSIKSLSGFNFPFQETKNVFAFTSVPQTDVLARADVFITHGGLSSIKESIQAEVPMLMVPVHNDFDPRGNSARVAYHNLGLLGDAARDSTQDISRKITTLLSDPSFVACVRTMKQKNATYTPEKFLGHFYGLTPIS